jgi:hypothetical protein
MGPPKKCCPGNIGNPSLGAVTFLVSDDDEITKAIDFNSDGPVNHTISDPRSKQSGVRTGLTGALHRRIAPGTCLRWI